MWKWIIAGAATVIGVVLLKKTIGSSDEGENSFGGAAGYNEGYKHGRAGMKAQKECALELMWPRDSSYCDGFFDGNKKLMAELGKKTDK